MDINKYIRSKNKCYVFNLTKNETILNELNLDDYQSSDKYEMSLENTFSNQDLVIFVIRSDVVNNKKIFKITNKLNNVLIYVIDDICMQDNETKYRNIFISYGYKYHGKTNNDKGVIFIYDIAEYKDNPDWLNNKNWANPELWEK